MSPTFLYDHIEAVSTGILCAVALIGFVVGCFCGRSQLNSARLSAWAEGYWKGVAQGQRKGN